MRRAALTAVVFGVFGGPLVAEDLGPAFAGYSISFAAGLGTPSDLVVEVGTLTGTLDFKNDSSPLEHAALHCVGSFGPGAQGLCAILTMVDAEAAAQAEVQQAEIDERFNPMLNHLFATYECMEATPEDVPAGVPGADSCTLTFTDGTGAFQGATGSAMLIAAWPITPHPDGSASAFARVSTFDLVLPQ